MLIFPLHFLSLKMYNITTKCTQYLYMVKQLLSSVNFILQLILSFITTSVCPSIKHVHCGKMEERSVHIFILYETSFSLVF